MDTIRQLNMTKSAYNSFEVQWNSHRTALAVLFSNVRNSQRLHERAEGNILLMNDIKHEYAVTAGQLIFLNSRDSPITSGYITGLTRQLEAKLNELERLFPQLIVHGGRPTTFGHTTMQQYFDAIKDECHKILVKILRQLIFSILMNDNELRRPNSTGIDKAARLLVSIASSTKKAGLVVDSINNFVDRNFGGDHSKKVPSVAIELQRLRNNQDADFLRLSQGMKDWHTLRKCVEETSILVEEAQRYEQNLIARIDGIYEAAR
ncbi:Antiviral helicase ski2 [Mucor velutinosus]|uniref:Antiviral helicase ski2 n=1 Tax=Mucor velutinosus TaxID=708070 RepID=A0AAN7DBR1_9FUNG|nr:Antiviral helicase ski2 [Mucor velutinosus]